MTPADIHRIATEYGIDPATIPAVQYIPYGATNDRLLTPKERIKNSYALFRRGRQLAAADKRAGRSGAREYTTWGED